jgi:glycosyltransferase involved in cell wall biosynthesis
MNDYNKIKLTVIIPFYNEEGNLTDLHKELSGVLNEQGYNSEAIYVNDGSSDTSLKVLKNAIRKTKESKVDVKVINFKKNFGQTAAIKAGIDEARGKFVSFLDADGQNDPNDIPRFVEKIQKGYDAVFGWRKERNDRTLRRVLSGRANKLISLIFSYPYHDVGCSARVVKNEYLKDLQLYGELHRILPVLAHLKGARIAEIVVNHRSRKKGKSKYGYSRIVKTIIDILTTRFLHSYGTKPAYVFGSFGLGNIFLGSITLLIVAYKKLFLGVFVHRDPLFLITIFLMLLGTQFIMMGLLAELQVRTYFESQGKPIYDIKNIETY